MTTLECSKIELKIGSSQTAANTIPITMIEWNDEMEISEHYTTDQDSLQAVSLGKYKVTGRFVVKSFDTNLDTYLAVPRPDVPYMAVVYTDLDGSTTRTATFSSPIKLTRRTISGNGPPELAEQTIEFIAGGVSES